MLTNVAVMASFAKMGLFVFLLTGNKSLKYFPLPLIVFGKTGNSLYF